MGKMFKKIFVSHEEVAISFWSNVFQFFANFVNNNKIILCNIFFFRRSFESLGNEITLYSILKRNGNRDFHTLVAECFFDFNDKGKSKNDESFIQTTVQIWNLKY